MEHHFSKSDRVELFHPVIPSLGRQMKRTQIAYPGKPVKISARAGSGALASVLLEDRMLLCMHRMDFLKGPSERWIEGIFNPKKGFGV